MMQQIANFIVDHDPMMVLRIRCDTPGGHGTRVIPILSMKRSFACSSVMNAAAI